MGVELHGVRVKHPSKDSGCLLWTAAELGDSPDDVLDVILAEVKLSSCCGEGVFMLWSVAELAYFLYFDEDAFHRRSSSSPQRQPHPRHHQANRQFSRRPQQATPVHTRVLNPNSVTALEFVGKLTLGGRITLR